ncbi:hypothetical protein GCM10023194_32250 [Planotetraspora phitsanulokensis]|uniref:Uncharacterized protein n=1 Tax=Planotetraspora phitsanulokensis TaxID=575192 RepID=A0A8J3TZV6_9ACTN|nr:hypothetical protein Pph01_06390 [Planotetraspora phitsanulokensis]
MLEILRPVTASTVIREFPERVNRRVQSAAGTVDGEFARLRPLRVSTAARPDVVSA